MEDPKGVRMRRWREEDGREVGARGERLKWFNLPGKWVVEEMLL